MTTVWALDHDWSAFNVGFTSRSNYAWHDHELTHQVALQISQHPGIFIRTQLKLESRQIFKVEGFVSVVVFVDCSDSLLQSVKDLSRWLTDKLS